MKYEITVYTGSPCEKHFYTFTQKQFDKLWDEVASINYDGTYMMKNGDMVEAKEIA